MKTILVATTNAGKLKELGEMLDIDAEFKGLADYPGIPEVEEDGDTFEENAAKKALEYAQATGLWTIADDSGLVIDALDGAPGIHSARFSGEKSSDKTLIDHKNIEKVLKLLQGVPAEKRCARFVCSICLASPEKVLIQTEGTVEGTITETERGQGGFGYDPIFLIKGINKTAAELKPDEKNKISHRGNAIGKLKELLSKLLD
jgi:XTP/dITP diphosphohydrolase